MTDLSKDVAVVLAPVLALAKRLSAIERHAIERACDEVIRICEDDEKETERLCELIQELEQKAEDAS